MSSNWLILDLEHGEDVINAMQVLQSADTGDAVERIRLVIHQEIIDTAMINLCRMFTCLRALPLLQGVYLNITFRTKQSDDRAYPACVITSILKRIKHLTYLSLKNMIIKGDTRKLAKVLESQGEIESLHLINTRTSCSGKTLGSLMRAVSNIPPLTSLRLINFALGEDNTEIIALAENLATKSTLRRLVIGCPRARRGQFLLTPGLNALGKMMESNQSIEELTLYVNGAASPTALITGLRNNRTLRQLRIFWNESVNPSNQNISALCEVLQQPNCKLHEVELGVWSRRKQAKGCPSILKDLVFPEIALQLMLNRAGIHRPAEADLTGQNELWINGLISYRDNLDVLFHFLGQNPVVCHAEYGSKCSQS